MGELSNKPLLAKELGPFSSDTCFVEKYEKDVLGDVSTTTKDEASSLHARSCLQSIADACISNNQSLHLSHSLPRANVSQESEMIKELKGLSLNKQKPVEPFEDKLFESAVQGLLSMLKRKRSDRRTRPYRTPMRIGTISRTG